MVYCDDILWYTVVYCGILWYTVMIYCDILWYTVVYSGILWYTVMIYCGVMVVAPVVFLSHHFHIMYASNQNLEAGKALVLSPDFIYHFQWNTWGTESA